MSHLYFQKLEATLNILTHSPMISLWNFLIRQKKNQEKNKLLPWLGLLKKKKKKKKRGRKSNFLDTTLQSKAATDIFQLY